MADISKLPILTSASNETYLLTVDNGVAKRLPFPGAGQLRGNTGYVGSQGPLGYIGSASRIPGATGSQGYVGSVGFTGSSGYAVDRGYTGSQGVQGLPGPLNQLNATTLPDLTTASWALEYFVGVPVANTVTNPIISVTNPVVFNTVLGQIGVGTTATQGTLHLKSSTSTAIFLEVTNTATKHQIYSDPVGNFNIDVDTFDAAGGSNFYISQAGAHKITVLPNGNVGITTDQPQDTLDVSGVLRISSNNIISKSFHRSQVRDDSRLYWENFRYAAVTSAATNNTLYAGTRIVGDIDNPETGGVFSFDNAVTNNYGLHNWRQRMTIIENGFVGINITRPTAQLVVNLNSPGIVTTSQFTATLQLIGADTQANIVLLRSYGSTDNLIQAIASSGTAAVPAASNPLTELLTISAGGYGVTRTLPGLAGIQMIGVGSTGYQTYTDSDAAAAMEIFTTNFGTTSSSLSLWIGHDGKIATGGENINGAGDLTVRQCLTVVNPGSLSLAGSSQGAAGISYILMGNSNGLGSAGPLVVMSSDRNFQIGLGDSFTSRTGGNFFRNFSIDQSGNGDIYGNWTIDGGAASYATMSTIKTTFNLIDTTATTVNFAGTATQINMGNATAATILARPGTIVGANATQNLYDTVATTMNFARTATSWNAGANTGVATIGNPAVQGTQLTQYLWNTTATTVYFAGSATQINIGNATAATMLVRPGTIVGANTTQTLFNSVTTSMYFAGAVTSLNMGSQADGSIATIYNPTVVGVRLTQNLWNTVATTVNAFGVATAINIGSSTVGGVVTISNPTVTIQNSGNVQFNINGINPVLASSNNGTLTLFDTNITAVNAFGNANTINIGKDTSGLAVFRTNVTIDGNLIVNGTNTIVNANNIQTGDKVLYLSTTSGNGAIAVGSGISVGPVGATYIDWHYDGGSNWVSNHGIRTTGGVNATGANNNSGDLQIVGGAGIALDLYVGGTLTVTNIVDTGLTAGQIVYPDSTKKLVGTSNLFWDATNNRLGLGTNTPSDLLTIDNQSASSTAGITLSSAGTVDARIYSNSTNLVINSLRNNPVVFQINSAEYMRIDGAEAGHLGNVGIGTTSPLYQLVVSNAGAAGLEFNPTGGINGGAFIQAYNRSTSAYDDVTYYANAHHFTAGANEKVTFASNGLVGIGNTSPAYLLEVGSSGTRGQLTVSGNSALGSPTGIPTISVKDYAASGSNFSFYGGLSAKGNLDIFDQVAGTYRVVITAAGNIGMGTASPSAKLHVVSDGSALTLQAASSTGGSALTMVNSAGTTVGGLQYYSRGYAGGTVFGVGADGLALYQNANAPLGIGTYQNAQPVIFGTNSTERMRVDGSSGYLGINTTSPGSLLDVRGGYITAGTGTGVTGGTTILRGYYSGDAGTFALWGSEYSSGGPVMAYALTPSSSASGAFVSATPQTISRGAYTINGNTHKWFVGPTQGTTIGSPATTTQVMTLSGSGDLAVTGNVTAYYSDERLKTQLGPIDNAVDKVKSLTGFYYEANLTAQALGYKVKREVGVSAQAVEKILPEIVSPAPVDDQYLTIDYAKLTPLLIEAIKEQQATMDQMAADIAMLKSKLGL